MLMMPSVSIMTFAAVVVAVGLVIAWYLGGIVPAESPSNVKPLTATELLEKVFGRAVALEQDALSGSVTPRSATATGHNDDDGGFRKVA
jgi:hypothetical protein